MKCPYCGGNLTLEDRICPYCKRSNKAAKTYTDTLDIYEDRLEDATQKVEKTTRFVKKYTVLLGVTIVLAILNIVVITLRVKSEDIRYKLDEKRANRNFIAYESELEKAYADRDYFLAANIYSDQDIFDADNQGGYSDTISLVYDLKYILEDTIYLTDPITNSPYKTDQEVLDDLANHIKQFYEDLGFVNKDYVQEKLSQRDKIQQSQLIETQERNMMYYLKLSKEQIESLDTMSKAQIAMLIGRSLGIYE